MFDDEKKLNEQEEAVTNYEKDVINGEESTTGPVNDISEDKSDDYAAPEYVAEEKTDDTEGGDNYFDNKDENSLGYVDDSSSGESRYNSFIEDDSESREQNNYGDRYYGGYSYDQNDDQYDMYNRKSNKRNKTIAIVAAVAITAIVFTAGVMYTTDKIINNVDTDMKGDVEKITSEEKVEYPSIQATGDDSDAGSSNTASNGFVITDVSDIVEDCMPSIVSITSTTIVESTDWSSGWPFFDYGYGESDQGYEEQVGAGSGFVVKQTDTELLIVTNNHVVAGADSLSVQFVNGTSIEGVTKSTDETADIAIVSIPLADIDSDTLGAIKIATLGSSDDTRVGEGVVAIGNALGYGQSVTTGVISAKEREIAVDNQTMVVLQTDAAINGGNSGGALINSKGEVIGINVAKYSSSSYSGAASVEGMGFAIPISQATDIINNLMSRETREKVDEKEKGALGIMGVAVDSSVSEVYSLPQGIYIREVIEGGAAEKAGLRATDVITQFDGQTVATMESLQEKLEYYKAGETVTLTIYRNTNGGYQEKKVDVTLSSSTILDESETE